MTTADIEDRASDEGLAQRIIESMPAHAWSASPSGQFTYVTPSTLDYLGSALGGLNEPDPGDEFGWRRLVHPDDYERVAARWRHCLKTGERYDTEHRLLRADGVYRWCRNSGLPSRDDQGRITQWYGTTIDIDEQKQAEQTLRERERELQQLIDMVPSHLWRLRPDGEPVYFNRRMVEYLGMDADATERPGTSRLDVMIAEVIHPDDAASFRDSLHRSLATGDPFALRYRLRRADGIYRWMSSRAEALRDGVGAVHQWYGLCHDIDDQVKAEAALQKRERELSLLVDVIPVHIGRMDASGEPTYFSRRTFDYLGITEVSAWDTPGLARSAAVIANSVHPDDAASMFETRARALKEGEPFALRFRLRGADGAYRWLEGRTEPSRDENGEIVEWYSASLDIDDQVRAEEALRRSEQRLRRMIDAVPVRIWSATPAGGPTYFNQRYQDHFRTVIDDFDAHDRPTITDMLSVLVHPEDAPMVQANLARCFESGQGGTMRFRWREQGDVFRWAECRMDARREEDGTVAEWYGVSIDIDEEMQAQEALRERERELQQLIDTVPVQIWCVTPDGEPSYINKTMVDYIGLDLEFFDAQGGLAEAIHTIVHPDDRAPLGNALRHSFTTGEPFALNYRNRRADGIYRWTEGHAAPFRDASGRIAQWYGVNVDIDDRIRLYSDLEEREARIRRLVDSDIIGIVFWDIDGTLIDANDAFLRMVQYDRDDVKSGLRWLDMTPPDWQEVHAREEAEELARTGRMQAREKEYFRKDGSRVPVLIGGAFFEGQARQGVAYILDLTERKRAEAAQARAEEALRKASDDLAKATQKASLAELSASIAHEVNQPLAAVVANSHACERWLAADPPNLERAHRTIERIIRDANAAADVVARIRALFRQDAVARENSSMGTIVTEARDLMAGELARRGVRVTTTFEDDLPAVAVDRIQIQQVLVNLMRNGMEAMGAGAGDRTLTLGVRRAGDLVEVEVVDSGPGIANPDRIFEPFFTTKGEGMGMGLAICRSIIESHGGRLWAERAEPRGARFVFTLPVDPQGSS